MLRRAVSILALLVILALALRSAQPPAVRPPRTPADFSNDNALAHVRIIATEPHPNGSPANDAVRAYLANQIQRLGLEPVEQTATVPSRYGYPITVRNVITRFSGNANRPQQAILLCAHYDSVPAGPGAADDAAAVAALLETLRALRAGPPLARDVIVLFTDAEEFGLLGARAFCADDRFTSRFDPDTAPRQSTSKPHPWLADIAVVLNFEARGTTGPSIMFETAPGNLKLLRLYAQADPHPVANSLSNDVYRLMRNDTDFTIFRRANKVGLNFAFGGGYTHYHTPDDTPENLDPRSLYHHGRHALSLTRALANLPDHQFSPLIQYSEPDAVAFNPWPNLLVVYSAEYINVLSLIQWLITAAVLFFLIKSRRLRLVPLLLSLLRLLLAMALTALCAWALLKLIDLPQTPAAIHLHMLLYTALALLITLLCAAFKSRPADAHLLAIPAILVWSLLAIPINRYTPGGSYLSTWPPLLASLALVVSGPSLLRQIAAVLLTAPILLIVAPLFFLAWTALTLALAPLFAPLLVFAAWLLIPAVAHPGPAPVRSNNPEDLTPAPQ